MLASTGNKAAAYAAFCARAGIRLWIFLTSTVPAEKLRELALYGAEVVKIAGTYDQAKQVASDFAARRKLYLDAGAQNLNGREAFKTVAFEIAEQLAQLEPSRRWALARAGLVYPGGERRHRPIGRVEGLQRAAPDGSDRPAAQNGDCAV